MMNNTHVIYESLTLLAKRLYGAIDMWTLACLDRDFPNRHQFLKSNKAKLQSIAHTLSETVSRSFFADLDPHWPIELQKDTQIFCDAFSALENFQALSPSELESACSDVDFRFKKIHDAANELMQSGLSSKYEWPIPAQWESNCEEILNRLAAQFSHARSSVTTT